MSHVTDIILITAIEDGVGEAEEHPNAEKIHKFICSKYVAGLKKVDELSGGNKAMQCDVFMTAINYLDIPALVDFFYEIKWEMPECVQLLIKDEHDDIFKIYTPRF